ncbi:MAG: hypothetical protein J6N47_09120 [Lachnospiraceae bacterium]|nr:hypothetical protein [Lachnospiraceae bacterium]
MKKKIKRIITIIVLAGIAIIAILIAAYTIYGKWIESHRVYSDVRIAELKGNATLIRDGEYINIYDNVPLMENDEVILTKGTLVITVDNSTVLCLEDGTDIKLEELGGEDGFSTEVYIYSGAITGRILPNRDHPLTINTSSCGILTPESIFRISAPYDDRDARISVFDGNAVTHRTGFGGLIMGAEVVTPSGQEAYYWTDDSSSHLRDDEFKEIDYDTIPPQGVAYLQLLSEDAESERLKEFLEAAAEELANAYVHVNKSNGELDTILAIGEASVVLDSVDEGDYVFFGNYDQGFTPGNEKIEWLVVDKKDGKALLISRYALASDCFDVDMPVLGKEHLNWQNSNVREWLNTDFYENAFSDEEKALIIRGANGVSDDNVFLLSESDAIEYFNGKAVKKEYAVSDTENCNAALVLYPCEQASVPGSSKGSCNWLLRTFSEGNKVMIVNEYGAIATADPDDYMGVRPAIYLEY